MKIETFSGQAEEIHRKNIENYESAQEKIATDRIEQFFNGQLKLSWKSILYEINKLPELSRTKYFQKLVEKEKDKSREIGVQNGYREGVLVGYQKDKLECLEAIAQWSIWTFLRERKKAPEWIKIQKEFMKNMKGN